MVGRQAASNLVKAMYTTVTLLERTVDRYQGNRQVDWYRNGREKVGFPGKIVGLVWKQLLHLELP